RFGRRYAARRVRYGLVAAGGAVAHAVMDGAGGRKVHGQGPAPVGCVPDGGRGVGAHGGRVVVVGPGGSRVGCAHSVGRVARLRQRPGRRPRNRTARPLDRRPPRRACAEATPRSHTGNRPAPPDNAPGYLGLPRPQTSTTAALVRDVPDWAMIIRFGGAPDQPIRKVI